MYNIVYSRARTNIRRMQGASPKRKAKGRNKSNTNPNTRPKVAINPTRPEADAQRYVYYLRPLIVLRFFVFACSTVSSADPPENNDSKVDMAKSTSEFEVKEDG